MKYQFIRSTTELLHYSEPWDALLERSSLALPTLSADCIARYMKTFEADSRFLAIAVVDGDRWHAALPLIVKRHGIFKTLRLPNNPWTSHGDLIVENEDNVDTFEHLVEGLQNGGADAAWFDWIDFESNRWRAFANMLQQKSSTAKIQPQFHIGYFDLDADFESYFGRLSKSRRKSFRYSLKQAAKTGDLRFRVHEPANVEHLRQLVTAAFELEHRGWKGREGSSVIANDGVLEFYLAQAESLWKRNQFVFYSVDLDGKMIAYEYGYLNQRVYFSQKVGYDESYAKFSPGHLLILKHLEHYHQTQEIDVVDTVGELTEATRNWITSYRTRGRLLAPLNLKGKCFVAGFDMARKLKNRIRPGTKLEPPKTIKPAKSHPGKPSQKPLPLPSSVMPTDSFTPTHS